MFENKINPPPRESPLRETLYKNSASNETLVN